MAAAIEPARFPIPPTTTTMNALRTQSTPMAWLTPTNGPNNTPLAAAMPAPIAKTPVRTHGTGMPIAWAMTRSWVVARIQMPQVPNLRNSQSPPMIAADSNAITYPVPRVVQVKERELAGERLLDLARHRAELPQRIILQDERNPEGGEDRIERIAAEQRAQCRQVYDCAEQRYEERSRYQGDPEISGGRQYDDADIGAQHEEFAMGKIDHVHDAENQCQTRRDERQDHAGDDAVDCLDQDLLDGNVHATHPDTDGSRHR